MVKKLAAKFFFSLYDSQMVKKTEKLSLLFPAMRSLVSELKNWKEAY